MIMEKAFVFWAVFERYAPQKWNKMDIKYGLLTIKLWYLFKCNIDVLILMKEIPQRHYILKTVDKNLLVQSQGVLHLITMSKYHFYFEVRPYQDLSLFFESCVFYRGWRNPPLHSELLKPQKVLSTSRKSKNQESVERRLSQTPIL